MKQAGKKKHQSEQSQKVRREQVGGELAQHFRDDSSRTRIELDRVGEGQGVELLQRQEEDDEPAVLGD